MNIANIKRANQVQGILESVDEAIAQAASFADRKTRNTHGYEGGTGNSLYQLHINEFNNGSGTCAIDLTNCGIGVEVIAAISQLLAEKRKKIIEEIETL